MNKFSQGAGALAGRQAGTLSLGLKQEDVTSGAPAITSEAEGEPSPSGRGANTDERDAERWG